MNAYSSSLSFPALSAETRSGVCEMDDTTPAWTSHSTESIAIPGDSGTIVPLKYRLQAAMVEEFLPSRPISWTRRKFLPRDQLDTIISPKAIREELRRSAPGIPRIFRDLYTGAICNSRSRIFAILVLIDQSSIILRFIQDDLTDSILPVSLRDNGGDTHETVPWMTANMPCFSGFSRNALDAFQSNQWAFLAPYFAPDSAMVPALTLDPDSILPFIFDPALEGNTHRGGFSTVYKIKIHQAHLGPNIEKEQYFACKEILVANDEAFESEVDALEKVARLQHPHLIRAITSIRKGNERLIIFPWAAGGNLTDFWANMEDHSHHPRAEAAKWATQQMHGIASGLRYLEDRDHNHDLYGRHGDIKPGNFLWFRSDSLPGILVLSDFGLGKLYTRPSRPESDRLNGYSPDYCPPEVQLKPEGSQAYDMWSLGCVYLEMITWVLKGKRGVDALSLSRKSTLPVIKHRNQFQNAFFEASQDPAPDRVVFKLKSGVSKFISQLRADSVASPFLHLLDFVQHRMLEMSPDKRAKASEVFSYLDVFLADYGNHHDRSFPSRIHGSSWINDEDWDEYGVNDPLQHNLIAGNIDTYPQACFFEPQSTVFDILDLCDDGSPEFDTLRSDIPAEQHQFDPAPPQPGDATVDSGYWTLPTNQEEEDTSKDSYGFPPRDNRGLEITSARPSTSTIRFQPTTDSSLPEATIAETLHSTCNQESSQKFPLFPCPFYERDPTKFGTKEWSTCMGPGWTISRLKEHIYRRHCLSKFVCERCHADFRTQLKLGEHQSKFVCPKLSEPVSSKINNLKKCRIQARFKNKPDAEKWTAIYRILFDCDPPISSSLGRRTIHPDNRNNRTSQATESLEAVTSFEDFLLSTKQLGGTESSSERAQTCLDMIQEWRESQSVAHSTEFFQGSSTIPHSDSLHLGNVSISQPPGNETETEPLSGMDTEIIIPELRGIDEAIKDWPFLDELNNACSDQWLTDTFPGESSEELLGNLSNAAEGSLFIPGSGN